MFNILIFSQKGGSGKSTISDEIAFGFERDGLSFAFYSTDEQGDSLHETTEPDDAVAAVIDTPGVLDEDASDMIQAADLIIIPTRASGRDMTALERTRRMVFSVAPQTPVIIVINGWNRFRNARDFRNWLEEDLRDTERVTVLSQSEIIPRAEAEEISVVKYSPRSTPAKQINELLNMIHTTMESTKDYKNEH